MMCAMAGIAVSGLACGTALNQNSNDDGNERKTDGGG